MSKVLLIKPRFLGLEFQVITQPMGLLYIGAVLKGAGHETRLHDCAADYRDLKILRKTIRDWRPDHIGISLIVVELEQTRKIMRIIRDILPQTPVIFGGPWPSANPEESISALGADYVVLGEGEPVFPRLIAAIDRGASAETIPGTASLINGQVRLNPGRYMTETELDALPFPDWELLDNRLYARRPSFATVGCRPYISVITSRGCPYRCVYCHHTMGKVFRKRSVESVLSEMETLYFRYGFKEFEIIDDCFNLDRERMQAILTGIAARLGKVKLHFPNGVRADILEPEDLALFKAAGTVSACYAIETSSPRLQKLIRKNLDIEKAVRAINASVRAGIYSVGFFMLGFPTETYEEACDTVDFAARSSLHRAMFMLVTPFAGTQLAELAKDILGQDDTSFNPRYVNYFTNVVNISAMSDDQLHTVFQSAYKRFFLNPRRIWGLAVHHPRRLSLPRYAMVTLLKILPGRYHREKSR